jgi:hypothetical protein
VPKNNQFLSMIWFFFTLADILLGFEFKVKKKCFVLYCNGLLTKHVTHINIMHNTLNGLEKSLTYFTI